MGFVSLIIKLLDSYLMAIWVLHWPYQRFELSYYQLISADSVYVVAVLIALQSLRPIWAFISSHERAKWLHEQVLQWRILWWQVFTKLPVTIKLLLGVDELEISSCTRRNSFPAKPPSPVQLAVPDPNGPVGLQTRVGLRTSTWKGKLGYK